MKTEAKLRQVGGSGREALRQLATEWQEGQNQFDFRVAHIEKWAQSPDPDPREAEFQREAIDLIRTVRASIAQGDAAQAARFALNLGIVFQKSFFKSGRKPGATAAPTKAIRELVAQHPGEKPAQLWARLIALPGWQGDEADARHRKSDHYISRASWPTVVRRIRNK